MHNYLILENATIICDYVIAIETEISIKKSAKEGRIKIIAWPSNYCHNKNTLNK